MRIATKVDHPKIVALKSANATEATFSGPLPKEIYRHPGFAESEDRDPESPADTTSPAPRPGLRALRPEAGTAPPGDFLHTHESGGVRRGAILPG
ncbi:MAG: hypothetical protein KKF90_07490 [Alphaproteobacteria bacterium]|nr:hypothetical protein [Alphaproteobacteria bacterium]MBU4163527.1 hypothetical protein [Alphaproteobacteria bacterium]